MSDETTNEAPWGFFTCGLCGKTLPKGRSDEEAMAEYDELWAGAPDDDLDVACDDCFQMMTSRYKPNDFVFDEQQRRA